MLVIYTFIIVGFFVGFLHNISFNILVIIVNVLKGLVGMFFGMIVGLFFAVMIGKIINPKETKKVIDSTIYLENLSDNSGVEGSFFLGCGSINNKMSYSFYAKDQKSDMFSLETIPSDNAKIKYSSERPRLETYHYEPITNKSQKRFGYWKDDGPHHIFYIPNGSISNTFKLNAQ